MKKLRLLFSLSALTLAGCATPNVTASSSSALPSVSHHYEISETSCSLKVGQEKKLYASDNGTIVSNVTWSSSNIQVVSVTADGTIIAIKEGKANVFGTFDSGYKLVCEVTVVANEESKESTTPSSEASSSIRETAIVKFFKNNADSVLSDGTSYVFVSAKSKYDYTVEQTLIWDLYFLYDTSDNSCVIKSQMNGTHSSGKKFYYYGYNVFYWGDYRNGLFVGGYCQEKSVGSDTFAKLEVEYDNSSLVFRTDHTLTMSYDLYYTVKTNEFSSDASSDDVLTIFSRVTECCSYAHEVFENYESKLTLY